MSEKALRFLGGMLGFWFCCFSGVWADSATLVKGWQKAGWNKTNFHKTQVNLEEIVSGGPTRESILPLDQPKFESTSQAKAWLPASEPVLVYRQGQKARAYPLRILLWHQVVNDHWEGQALLITYDPLTLSGMVFRPNFLGKSHTFGVSGLLRHSNLILWDRTSESWWQQMTGEALTGDAVGQRLESLPAWIVPFSAFQESFPEAEVLSPTRSDLRPYGETPYPHYEAQGIPFFMRGTSDPRLPNLARVLGFEWQGQFYLLPLSELSGQYSATLTLGHTELIILNPVPAYSLLQTATIRQAPLVDAPTLWENLAAPQALSFFWDGSLLREAGAKTPWNALGPARPASPNPLKPLKHGVYFAFSWLALHPETQWLRLNRESPEK